MTLDDIQNHLKKVENLAKEMYAASDQGAWEDLPAYLQRFWIDHAGRELNAEESGTLR